MRNGKDIAADAVDLEKRYKRGWMTRDDFRFRIQPLLHEMDIFKAVREAERIVKWGL